MSAKYFIDTNILIYALDKHDPDKQEMARELLKLGGKDRVISLSTQVLQEFYVAATRKLGVKPVAAKQMVSDFSIFETVTISVELIHEAIDCSALNNISFWDALIVVAAGSLNCSEIWSEDLNDGQLIRGVLIRNPFKHFDELIARF